MSFKHLKMRESFDFSKISKELYQWFPGHMASGLKSMFKQLSSIDAIIEVHDARVSLVSFFSSSL
jgi:ribosome biogenesis GTPase A